MRKKADILSTGREGWAADLSLWAITRRALLPGCPMVKPNRERIRPSIGKGAEDIAKRGAPMVCLRQDGVPTREARALLLTFEGLQGQHEDDLVPAMAQHG
jgi:hypothetical protein